MEVIPCWIQTPCSPSASPEAPFAPATVMGGWETRRSPGIRKHSAETAGKHLSPRPPGDPPTGQPHLHSLPRSCPVPAASCQGRAQEPHGQILPGRGSGTAHTQHSLPSVTRVPSRASPRPTLPAGDSGTRTRAAPAGTGRRQGQGCGAANLGHSPKTCRYLTHPGCVGQLAAATSPSAGTASLAGSVQLLEDVLSPSQHPGDTAGVLPIPGLARAAPGREEEEAAKGTGTIEGCPWHRRACSEHSRDLSLLQKGIGAEQEVSALYPHHGQEQTLNPAAPWAAHAPSSHLPGGATSPVCRYRNGQSLFSGCSSVSPPVSA